MFIKINEREQSIKILEEIFKTKAYNNIVLKKTLKQYEQVPVESKAFITEVVNGTLRNLIFIDYTINLYSKTPIKRMKPFILNLLRISVYQLLFMDKVPSYAAINEAVKLCRKRGFNNLCGFINGVLRAVPECKEDIFEIINSEYDELEALSLLYSVPLWILEVWQKSYGLESAKDICKSLAERPKVTICVNTTKVTKKELAAMLEAEGINVNDTEHEFALEISGTSDISRIGSFNKGLFHVMDLSAMMAMDLLGNINDQNILDICAAPGGKTFYTAYKSNNKGKITARDIYSHKMDLLNNSAKRLGLYNINSETGDALITDEQLIEKFEIVIVDAPCSGLGLLRKKPDIKLYRSKSDIADLIKIQKEILTVSSKYVKKGGSLLYLTCTLNKEENENMASYIETFEGFKLMKSLTIMPYQYNSDGFFAALFKKEDETHQKEVV